MKVLAIHANCRHKLWLNSKNSWTESSNIFTTWKVRNILLRSWNKKLKGNSNFEQFCERAFLVLTHHTLWCIVFGWHAFLPFLPKFASFISFKAWFEIVTNSKKGGYIFKSSIFFHYLAGIFIFLKGKCQDFHFLDLVGRF